MESCEGGPNSEEGQEAGNAGSFRPLCLLNTLSKLYEALIRLRLEGEIEEKGGLAEQQYGFRKGRSTTQAMQVVRDAAKNPG